MQFRSQSNPLPANSGEPQPCMKGCGDVHNNCHIIQCNAMNKENQGDYNLLINVTLHEMKNNLGQWKNKLIIFENIGFSIVLLVIP